MPPIKPSDSVKLFCKVKTAVAQMGGGGGGGGGAEK